MTDKREELNKHKPIHLIAQLNHRMGWSWGEPKDPFVRITAQKMNDAIALWVIVDDNKHVVLEDNLDLYPSDALVTKLRLLADRRTP
jgi:hypothetical protein